MKLSLLFIVLFVGGTFSSIVPPAGVYITLRNDAIQTMMSQLSLLISDKANTYTDAPPYSGATNDAKFTFQNFQFNVALNNFKVNSQNGNYIQSGWNNFNFYFTFNFKICATRWPNPCDDGWIRIYTISPNVQLFTGLNVDFSGPNVKVTASDVDLEFGTDAIWIQVQCTSTFCLVPVSDIEQAVATNFVTTFQNGMVQIINEAAEEYLDSIATTVPFPEYLLNLDLDGSFVYNSGNLIISASGSFLPNSNQKPPFNPSTVPPDSVFQSPPGQLSIVFTDYLPRTAIWALNMDGDFTKTITNADLPSNSPIQLNTNSPLFQVAAPGLKAYPNTPIVVQVQMYNTSAVSISNSAISLGNTVQATFFVANSSVNINAFTLLLDIDFDAKLSAGMNGNDISVTPSYGNWATTASLVSSSIGPINTVIFGNILNAAFGSAITPSTAVIPTPQDFSVSSPSVNLGSGYAVIASNIAYTGPIPSQPCGSSVCPLQSTCCSNPNGYDCCNIPNASCCANGGCCPQGSQCVNNQCYSRDSKTYSSVVNF